MLFLIYKSLVMRKHYNSKQKENHKNQKTFPHEKTQIRRLEYKTAVYVENNRLICIFVDYFVEYLTFCMFKTLQKSAVLADFSGILSNIKVFLRLFFLAIKFDRIEFCLIYIIQTINICAYTHMHATC